MSPVATPAEKADRAARRPAEARRSWAKRGWYGFLWIWCRLAGAALFRLRCWGEEHFPAAGGVLVLCNHQSHFDPLIVGTCCPRRLNFLARETLFRHALFRWLIVSLDAIPIDRDGLGMSGLKETLRRLKRGEMVLVFPEGTRSPDGEIKRLKPGFSALARRGDVTLLPMAIDGAFQAWPRWRKLPRTGVIHVVIGQPLTPDDVARFGERELVAEVERRMRECHARARRQRAISRGDLDSKQAIGGTDGGSVDA
jgi:1-acyl-sn-glycerol-3-phosphate acyltransferase